MRGEFGIARKGNDCQRAAQWRAGTAFTDGAQGAVQATYSLILGEGNNNINFNFNFKFKLNSGNRFIPNAFVDLTDIQLLRIGTKVRSLTVVQFEFEVEIEVDIVVPLPPKKRSHNVDIGSFIARKQQEREPST